MMNNNLPTHAQKKSRHLCFVSAFQTISIFTALLCVPVFRCSSTTTTSVSLERSSSPTTTTPTSQWPTRGCTLVWVRTAKQKEETECHLPWQWHISCQESSGLINRLHLSMETNWERGSGVVGRLEDSNTMMHFHSRLYASVSYLIFLKFIYSSFLIYV